MMRTSTIGLSQTAVTKAARTMMKELGAEIYGSGYFNDSSSALVHVDEVIKKNESEFELMVTICPNLRILLSNAIVSRFGFRVKRLTVSGRETRDLDERDAVIIGRSLITLVRKRKTGAAAVDSWRVNYKHQLEKLFDDIEGFDGFMVTIANSMLRDMKWGMIFRVCTSSVLSLFDATTDFIVIIRYRGDEKLHGQSNALLAMLIASTFVQVLIALGQSKRKGWKVKAREVLYCILFLRPAVDAYRVSTNHRDEEDAFEPLFVMMFNKASELAMEAIPGCLLQIYVLLTAEEAGLFELLSILASALSAGFTSAMISFDFDTSSHHRRLSPEFYGYLPDQHGDRKRCFNLLVASSVSIILSRSTGVALLAATDPTVASIFVLGELGLYFAYKIQRGDFLYFLEAPMLVAIPLSFGNRLIGKLLVDFVGCVQFRHPKEVGGIEFSGSVLWSLAMPFVLLALFRSEVGGGVVKRETIEIFLVCNLVFWCGINLVFFSTIKGSYLHTFYSTKTGPQFICDRFLNGSDDRQKFNAVFTNRLSYTKMIREEVLDWIDVNIDRWIAETPPWFKAEKIPQELLPARLVGMGVGVGVGVGVGAGGSTRPRRHHSLAHSLRESAKEMIQNLMGEEDEDGIGANFGKVHPEGD